MKPAAGGVEGLQRAQDRLHALMDTMRAFVQAASDYRVLLDTIADRVSTILGDVCLIALVGDDGTTLHTVALAARDAQIGQSIRSDLGVPLGTLSSGLLVSAIQNGRSVLIPRIAPEELARRVSPRYADLIRKLGVHATLIVPLTIDGRGVGAIALYRYEPASPPFDEEDLEFARSLADNAALAIANARLLDAQRNEIGERRRAEDQAKKFASLVHNSTDLIGMASFDGRILFVNDAGRTLIGIDKDFDVTTLTLPDVHTETGLRRADILLRDGSWQGEALLRYLPTGELIPVRVSSFVVRDDAGNPICFATLQHDLRPTKALEAQLGRAQRMEAVGQLAGSIAHDFNNILTVIVSYATILVSALKEGSDVREDASEILFAAERAASLTRQLLAFARKQVLELRVVQVNAILRQMEGILRRAASDAIRVELDLYPNLGRTRADPAQLEQAILNLVVNARDAMPSGGTLKLETSDVEVVDGRAPPHEVPAGRYVVLGVADTGTGIDAAVRARLFEPFFTTKPVGKGTGLGLAAVQSIVRQSGGYVTVESEIGNGTRFRLYFPWVEAALDARESHAASREQAPKGLGEGILLVEDDAQIRRLMHNVLARGGYEVVAASDASHAFAAAERAPQRFRLLVTDVVLPEGSGRELAERVVALSPKTRVLYVSGYAEDALGRHGVLEPGIELLRKPITPSALLQRVRNVLDKTG